MLKNIVEACCLDACEFCALPGCLKLNLEEHQRSKHGECMLRVVYLCLEMGLRAQTFPFIPTLLNVAQWNNVEEPARHFPAISPRERSESWISKLPLSFTPCIISELIE